ncbi:MAG: hypothetical protein DHS20C21_08220 [Gemmatimonadota bacterium]|nr:MAG: hypothetical protein DHS20C21_08220 [Gemmatimonadota bacterium]
MTERVESLLAEIQALRARIRGLEQDQRAILARYENATRAGRVGVWDIDLVAGRLFMDPWLKGMLGYSDDEVPNRPGSWNRLVHEDDRARRDAAVEACLNGTVEQYDVEHRVHTRDGEIRWIHTRGSLTWDEHGPVRFTGTDTDVTDRRRAEEDRERLQRQLHRAHKLEAVGTLAGGIAHDFNNILTVILGNSQLALVKESEGEPAREYIRETLEAGVRGRDIVRRILAFSQSGDGQRRSVSIRAAVQEALLFVRPFMPTTIQLQGELDAAESFVATESTGIHQVLLNLCSNSRDAMPDGGTIRIALRDYDREAARASGQRELGPGGWVVLEVEDDGAGIEPEYQDRVFDPFFSTKRPEKGTGLGLAMVYGIVQEHGGDVELDSVVGQGTTVRVYLPTCAPESDERPEPSAHADTPSGRVLLVDDEPRVLRAYRGMLEVLGLDVVAFTGSVEALQSFRNAPDGFDLVITDQTMPDLTGLRLAAEISRIRPQLPIVLCTGYSESVTEGTRVDAGVTAVMMKPFLADELAEVVRGLLAAASVEPSG